MNAEREHEFSNEREPARDVGDKIAYRRRYYCPCGQHPDNGLLFLVRLHNTGASQAV